MFKVVRGNPTPEELAAALAVVQARAAAAAAVEPGTPRATSGPIRRRRFRRAPAAAPGAARVAHELSGRAEPAAVTPGVMAGVTAPGTDRCTVH